MRRGVLQGGLLGLMLMLGMSGAVGEAKRDLAHTVDPFIGTGGHGHTFPGPCRPFGMVQLGPDTRLEGWDGCSAYHHSDEVLYGFSHTHLSGTGCSDYGDILLMPGTGPVRWANGADGKTPGYRRRFRHEDEVAEAGYYGVTLEDGTAVRLTTTPRVGIHEYTFAQEDPYLLIDLTHRDKVIDSSLEVVGDREIRGFRRSRAWSQDQHVYFSARFSRPFLGVDLRVAGGTTSAAKGTGEDVRAAVLFDARPGERVTVTVGISAVDTEGAVRNREAEAPHFDFERYRSEAQDAWRAQLGKIDVQGGSAEQQVTFYTALYHTAIAPNLFMDVDGRYRGTDLEIHKAEGYTHYTVFSLWDTFRAAHPLYTITERKRTRDFLHTFLAHYRDGGSLPIWELAGWYTGCMIGYHAIPVIADAWAKGIRDFDKDLMLEAMLAAATKEWRGLPSYREYGYIRAEDAGESVSRTLEYAYDDWCIAEMARAWQRPEVAREYSGRAQSWKNVFDPDSQFMRAKRNNRWIEPFQPEEVNTHFTEANSWQYSLFVPHDLDGLRKALGGAEQLEAWLDRLFSASSETSGREQADITGLIGQYAHGNEPSHHMAYLYVFAGKPGKTQQRVRQILDELYAAKPDGYCGNEDCGQMSAWYVLSALGFYPVTPGTDEYVIGSPLFPEATIHLENGKAFTIRAPGASTENCYIQDAALNGRPLHRAVLRQQDLLDGGELVLTMGARPSSWASGRDLRPGRALASVPIVAVPYVKRGERTFQEETVVELGTFDVRDEIFFSVEEGRAFTRYTGPFPLTRTTTLRAYALRDGAKSTVIESNFLKRSHDWKLTLEHPYANQYAASGPQALIDGLTGGSDWHTGGWQGFLGSDLVATIDFQKPQSIAGVRARFLQDQGSWIWLPSQVSIEISEDGATWRRLGEVRHEVDPHAEGNIVQWLGLQTRATARFVRLRARSVGTCPDWHPGAGNPCWIFADEIEIDVR
jgi:predicted alpha-1,2-mannosidase